ncbi:unnamed protein product [Amoebophrya sp. A120]|nr:unnamed protein product [Amoebophrya sp. A120]|eukprot:GSA120T00022527001.1
MKMPPCTSCKRNVICVRTSSMRNFVLMWGGGIFHCNTPCTVTFDRPDDMYVSDDVPSMSNLPAGAIDAWVWLKTPGEVDGCSHAVIPASSWWMTAEASVFRDLVGGTGWDPTAKFCNANVDHMCEMAVGDVQGLWAGSGTPIEIPDAGRFSPHNIITLATNAAILGIGDSSAQYTGCLKATDAGQFEVVTSR